MVDVVLLLAMLIGLLQDRNPGGSIWKLLYQQVTPGQFLRATPDTEFLQCIIWIALALITEIPFVVCPFPPLRDIQLTGSQVFFILNLNGAFLYLRFAHQCVEWD